MTSEPIDYKNVALQNEQLVISLLRRNGAMSQTQLRKLSGLSTSTSSYIIARLRNKGYILETKGVSDKRGAKPMILAINPQGCFAVGVELKPDGVYAGLFDFNASLIDQVRVSIESTDIDDVCGAISDSVRHLLGLHKQAAERLKGVAVAVSGAVEANSFVVLSSPMGWRNIALKDSLEQYIDYSVTIYSTQVRMLAELDLQSPLKNMLYINIGNGVGGHIIIDGKLAGGATGRTGEIGHIVMEPDGRKCGCGNIGCLETIISGVSISSKIKADIHNGVKSCLSSSISSKEPPESVVAKFGQGIKAGDRYCTDLAEQLSDYLCKAVCMMVNICDPEAVTLAGYVSENCFDFLAEKLKKAFARCVYNYSERKIVVNMAVGGKNALITGAAISVLQA